MPVGVYPATLDAVVARFGAGGSQRHLVTDRLKQVYALAHSMGHVQRFLLFGSYVSSKTAPGDVDIVLIMQDDFKVMECRADAASLFDHQRADQEFGVSLFWIRPSLLLLDTLDEFIAHWQVKRDGTRRGLVEIVP